AAPPVPLLAAPARAPSPATTDPSRRPTIEVWMSATAARQLGVGPGDTFDLQPFWREDVDPVEITIAGLVAPNDPTEDYWFGNSTRLVVDTTRWPTYPFIIDERTFVEVLAPYLPSIDGTFETFGFIDSERVNSRNAERVKLNLRALDRAIRAQLELSVLDTELADVVAEYQEKLFFTRLPLFALMLLIVGIALYYLVLVATMLVERQAGEIALLKSRGAGLGQIMTVYLIEGSALTVFAVVLGPLLASGVIRLLGPTPPFSDLSQGQLLRVALTPEAFGMAALGAVLALVALLWPAYRASGASMVHYKQSLARPAKQPLFLRYYLDLVLVGVGAFLFYQLRQRGSLVTENLFGDLSADPLLLVSPALFMLMIALVFLRLFPVVLGVASWALRGLSGATILLGLWRMVRSPLHYSRLILLLLLATSVGMFAAGFRATLDRSFEDRAAYEAGAAGRVVDIRTPARISPERLEEAIEAMEGLDNASAAARLDVSYAPATGRSAPAQLLGVGEDFAEVAYWRDDFGGDLDSMLDRLKTEETVAPDGPVVPADSRALGVWTRISLPALAVRPGIRVRDENGLYYEYLAFSDPVEEDDGWLLYVVDLTRPYNPRGSPPELDAPLEVEAVFLNIRRFAAAPGRVTAVIDDIVAYPEGGGADDAVLIEPFESLDRYQSITGASGDTQTTITRADVDNDRGRYAAQISFNYNSFATSAVGLRLRRSPEPLRVLASESFLDTIDAHPGDTIPLRINRQVLSVQIVGAFDLFPGFYPGRRSHLLVADLATLRGAGAGIPRVAGGINANEVWIGSVEGAELTGEFLEERGIRAAEVYDEASILELESSDPLVAASWEGILFLSFGAVLLLTALGFIVFSYLAAQTRSLEFAILRTMGFSGRQIVGVVGFEQLFVIVAGVAAGTALGFPLGRLMIGALALTEDGSDVVPPLLSQVSWETVLSVYGLLALVFIGTVAALARLYSRLALHRALRIGEL
ncbi:MAG: ABC transporter permease, partial [Dehalococcoidia bacterium]|nr:ABC transporter permease [Dehalococcoidia bacterium]